ncbi:hypothetical protein Y032_0559g3451 [Ancylostoma ceylanicum]|uniref:GIY-YIG domain-containing protein n=1 Tax=Ancylostoma ceylanicum TaxID=53326 RepID=A0A016WQ42_9BILA|nr:hypothetical protein Y032_0559g3451 [Ancylostoma ceylanicum]
MSIPNANIKKQLGRNRLYDRQCIYIRAMHNMPARGARETGRALNVRIKEHLASKRRGSLTSPLGRHRINAHYGIEFNVKCTILTCEAEIPARKELEAFWISVKNPEMNNKNDCVMRAIDCTGWAKNTVVKLNWEVVSSSFTSTVLQRLGYVWFKNGETIYFRTYWIRRVNIQLPRTESIGLVGIRSTQNLGFLYHP